MNDTLRMLIPDLGTFEGFNCRDHCTIERTLTARNIVDWEQDRDGEAMFWPSDNNPLLKGIFPENVNGGDLAILAGLLEQLDGDQTENLLRIQFACRVQDERLWQLTADLLNDRRPMIFYDDTIDGARSAAALKLFELYSPTLYKVWSEDRAGYLTFAKDSFLYSLHLDSREVTMETRKVLMLASK